MPVEVTARLSLNEKLVAKRTKGKEKADDAASAATPTTLDQADNEAHAFAEELEEAQAQQKDEIDRSLYDNSITSLLQEQANKGTRVPLLAEMARQWYTPSVAHTRCVCVCVCSPRQLTGSRLRRLELYESRMRELKRQKKAEAHRKKEAEEKSRTALLDLRKRTLRCPPASPPRSALHGLRVGLKPTVLNAQRCLR